ncbi:hypothetical protein FIV07_28150 (plasmid) [Mycobacterium sp. THAF192]|nr:hypothetical protein FIV07_28150 [Mycobacterium sp. THAF192]
MVVINSDRLVAVTDARTTLSALVGDARRGRMTHIVKGSEVVAHLVPPTARIIDQDALLGAMATALLQREAETICREKLGDPCGTSIHTGRLFVWAWRTDAQLFDMLLGEFAELLSASGDRQYSTAEVFDLVRGAMSNAGLGDSEIAATTPAGDDRVPKDKDKLNGTGCTTA